MDDLISRQALLNEILLIEKELLRDKEDARNSDDEQMLFAIDNQMNALWRARCRISNQPTAYDAEKVVEKLEQISYEHFDTPSFADQRQLELLDAVRIVRGGGKE